MFYNELELLEVRLAEGYNYVDKFIIVESDATHSDRKKGYLLKEHLAGRFLKYKDKIVYVKINFESSPAYNKVLKYYKEQTRENLSRRWINEHFQRDSAILCSDIEFQDEDILIVSDLDEIPFYKRILNVDWLDKGQTIHLNMVMCYYYLNTKLNCSWYHPYMIKYKDYKKYGHSLSFLRTNEVHIILDKAGLHLSNIGDKEYILQKHKDYAHSTEFDITESTVDYALVNVKDMFGRYKMSIVKDMEYFKAIKDNIEYWKQFIRE
jgi:hypothetical protein